jgi:hypothetical protein
VNGTSLLRRRTQHKMHFLSEQNGEKTMQLEAIYVYCHFADVTDVDMKRKERSEKCSFSDREEKVKNVFEC